LSLENSHFVGILANYVPLDQPAAAVEAPPPQSKMLHTYKELLLANTNGLSDNAKAEHAMALKCLRLRLFGGNAQGRLSFQNFDR
jgi:hypothetical protein